MINYYTIIPDATARFVACDQEASSFSTTTPVFSLVSPDPKTSPYAAVVASSGRMAKSNPFRFSTKWWDDETGLGWWGYRWYSPEMGRWTSSDPLGDRAFLDRFLSDKSPDERDGRKDRAMALDYLYVLNTPLQLVDVLGLSQTPLTPAQLTTCQNDLNDALNILRNAIQNVSSCACYFNTTTRCNGNVLQRLNNFQLSIDNSGDYSAIVNPDTTLHGWTNVSDGQWRAWITPYACRLGRWNLAATIIHELMHECDDNASGEPGAFGAETACGF